MQGTIAPRGELKATLIRGKNHTQVSRAWKLRNALRRSYLQGLLAVPAARLITRFLPATVITSELRATLIRADGTMVDYGVVSRKVVTNAGVAFIVDAFQGNTELEDMRYHGVGTGTGNEAAGDTALGTESTTILTVNSVRATGTNSESSAPVATFTATVSFDGSGAITEHGIFSDVDVGEGVLLDRSKFDAINVVSGDSILFTYSLTLTAGS